MSPPRKEQHKKASKQETSFSTTVSDDVDSELDSAFAAVQNGNSESPEVDMAQENLNLSGKEELENTFKILLQDYIRPISSSISKISQGITDDSVFESAYGALHPLKDAVKKMEFEDLEKYFVTIENELNAIRDKLSQKKSYSSVELEKALLNLSSFLKEKEEESSPKEAEDNLSNLLDRIDGVTPEIVKKLYSAGLNTVERISSSSLFDMAKVTGLEESLLKTIKDGIESHTQTNADNASSQNTQGVCDQIEQAEMLQKKIVTLNQNLESSMQKISEIEEQISHLNALEQKIDGFVERLESRLNHIVEEKIKMKIKLTEIDEKQKLKKLNISKKYDDINSVFNYLKTIEAYIANQHF